MELEVNLLDRNVNELNSKVAIASLLSETKQPNNFLFEVKTITKLPGNGIAESVKSYNLHKKDRILWF